MGNSFCRTMKLSCLSRRCSYLFFWTLPGTPRLDQQKFYNHITLKATIHSFGWVNWKMQTLTQRRVDLETKTSSTYNSTLLMITLSSRNWISWKSCQSPIYMTLDFKMKYQPLERYLKKWPKSRGPLGMQLVLNEQYTASFITTFFKFLFVNKVVKLGTGLSIFQMVGLLQLLTTVTFKLLCNLQVIYWHPLNKPEKIVKRELSMNVIYYLTAWLKFYLCSNICFRKEWLYRCNCFSTFMSSKPDMGYLYKKRYIHYKHVGIPRYLIDLGSLCN